MQSIKGIPIDERSRYTRMVGNINEIRNHIDLNGFPVEKVELINNNTIRIIIESKFDDWWRNRITDRELTSTLWFLGKIGTHIYVRLW